MTSADCPTGLVCRDAACVPSCTTDAECGAGRVCALGRCRIPAVDGGGADAPPPTVAASDRCDEALEIPLGAGTSVLTIDAREITDGVPSCSAGPDEGSPAPAASGTIRR